MVSQSSDTESQSASGPSLHKHARESIRLHRYSLTRFRHSLDLGLWNSKPSYHHNQMANAPPTDANAITIPMKTASKREGGPDATRPAAALEVLVFAELPVALLEPLWEA
jgi:hypothetical protein